MIKTLSACLTLFLFILSYASFAQTDGVVTQGGGVYTGYRNEGRSPCLTTNQYEQIEKTCRDNALLLGLAPFASRDIQAVPLQWPLRTKSGVNDCSYYFISAYVDHNPASGSFQDFNCGTTSYDGHQGTDIVPWPYPMMRMDNNELEVIAAAAGTIVNTEDGHFDKQCANNSETPNYIVIQHSDGTLGLYLHFKSGSLTSKTVGQTVTAGEFLGTVGSSGNSNGPHLHFEVRTGNSNNSFQDPFNGSCNSINSSSWWAAQKSYTEPALVKVTTNSAPPSTPGCPTVETPNDTACFPPSSLAYFVTFMRNEVSGTPVQMKILNSGGVAVASWTHNITTNYLATWRWFSRGLPALPGSYTFEATYNGTTCTSAFQINCAATGLEEADISKPYRIYPNPANGFLNIENDGTGTGAASLVISNMLNQPVYQNTLSETHSRMNLNLPAGCYFYRIRNENRISQDGKLVVQ